MSMLIFEDNEMQELLDTINQIQILFHPIYAPNGTISAHDYFELIKKDVIIILDNNLVSPIYEVMKNGKTKNENGLKYAAILLLFSKCIHARVSSGFALIENEMNRKSKISSDEKNEFFLQAIDNIHPMVWKKYVYGEINKLEFKPLDSINVKKTEVFNIEENIHFKIHKITLLKIVYYLRNTDLEPFEKFTNFLNWYFDNLIITESMVVYAAMIFSGVSGIKPPKNCFSDSFTKIISGIENQAWDMHHLSQWSTFYKNEENNKVFFFATNDITLKHILVNSIPLGEWYNVIPKIFSSKKQKEEIEQICEAKLGKNRIKPFELSDSNINIILDKLLESETKALKDYIE